MLKNYQVIVSFPVCISGGEGRSGELEDRLQLSHKAGFIQLHDMCLLHVICALVFCTGTVIQPNGQM